jgi:hypothetical protein
LFGELEKIPRHPAYHGVGFDDLLRGIRRKESGSIPYL